MNILNAFARLRAWRQNKALRRVELENPFRMLPTDDGGESYRMECVFCKEEGNIMSRFTHAADCPAGRLEQERLTK
jgi:hypothetical protein